MRDADTAILIASGWLGYSMKNLGHTEIIDTYNKISPLPRNYAVKYSDNWCAAFVSAVMWRNDMPVDDFPYECSCGKMVEKAIKMGIWHEDESEKMAAGDIVLYDWQDTGKGDNKGWPDHVGIISDISGDKYTVIEGNKGGTVAKRSIMRNGKFLRGFIRPDYKYPCEFSADQIDKWIDDLKRAVSLAGATWIPAAKQIRKKLKEEIDNGSTDKG